MRKHIERVLLVGAAVVLLAFGDPLLIPPGVEHNTNSSSGTEQGVSQYSE